MILHFGLIWGSKVKLDFKGSEFSCLLTAKFESHKNYSAAGG